VTLSALRGVAKACWLAGEMSAEDFQRLSALKSVKQTRLPAGRLLGPGELQALFAGCVRDTHDGNPAGPRDAALLGVLYAGGLRREEASRLQLTDLDTATGEVVVRGGKGNKDRNVYLATGARAAMADWLDLRGETPGPLWSRIRKGGHLAPSVTGLSDRSIGDLCHRRADWSGLKPFTPHDLRRTFISCLTAASTWSPSSDSRAIRRRRRQDVTTAAARRPSARPRRRFTSPMAECVAFGVDFGCQPMLV
jgi:integrase